MLAAGMNSEMRRRPRPPERNDEVRSIEGTALSSLVNSRKHFFTRASNFSAYGLNCVNGTVRWRWPMRGSAHWRSNRLAHCGSISPSWENRRSFLSILLESCSVMYSADPKGTPQTSKPEEGGIRVKPNSAARRSAVPRTSSLLKKILHFP